MHPVDKQTTTEIQRRMISLSSSSESFAKFLRNLLQISELSPLLQSQAAATLELVSLMTAALRVSQYATNRSNWTEDFTELENWKQHWRTAYKSFEVQSNIAVGPELFDDG